MKKIICAIMALILSACIFTACTGKNEKEGPSVPDGPTADPLASAYYAQTETQTNGNTTAIREDYIDQESSGITVDIMTTKAERGEMCIVSATGTPDAEFSIQLYHDYGTVFEIEGLEDGKSDEKGNVKWSFIIPEDTAVGVKAVIIREKGTDNYARAAIAVV